MKKFTLVLSLFLVIHCHSQQWAWARQATKTKAHQVSKEVCADHSGNSFILGTNIDSTWYGTTCLDSGSFVAKYNSNGAFVWAKRLPGNAKDIVTDSKGNLFVIGDFVNTVTAGSFTLTGGNYLDFYILELTPSGNIVFAKSYGGPKSDVTTAICIDKDDKLLITGYFQDSIQFDNQKLKDLSTNKADGLRLFFLMKLDTLCQCTWAVTCPYNFATNNFQYNTALYLAVDKNGNSYVSGMYSPLPCYGPCEGYFILKYDKNGLLKLNSRQWDCYSFPYGLAVDDSLNILVEYHTGSHYTSDCALSKYDSVMHLKWTKFMGAYLYGTNYFFGSGLAVDSLNYIYITGIFGGSGANDSVQLCNQTIIGKGNSDVLLGKFDASGNCLHLNTAGGKGYENYYNNGKLWVDKGGDCYLAGIFNTSVINAGCVPIDSIIFNTDTLHTDGKWQHLFLAKTNSNSMTVAVSKQPGLIHKEINIFPNPNTGQFTLINENQMNVYIKIYDLLGNCVSEKIIKSNSEVIDLGTNKKGIYFLEAENEKGKT
ncbi:MAG: T9SS type A sorting domain-containing protein, partial [Bacteroidia bacterium]